MLHDSLIADSWQFLWFSEWLYIIAITLTKLSLIFFFRRIFPGKFMRLSTLYFGTFILISNFVCFFVIIFQCYPVHGNWTNWMYRTPPVKCINTYQVVQVAAALGIFHDLVIMVMPLPTLWGLNLPIKKKLNLLAMFMIGIVVIICSCLRIPSLIEPSSSTDYSCKHPPVPTSSPTPFHKIIANSILSRGRLPNRHLDYNRNIRRHNMRLPPVLPLLHRVAIPWSTYVSKF
jgi:hypothetical protein